MLGTGSCYLLSCFDSTFCVRICYGVGYTVVQMGMCRACFYLIDFDAAMNENVWIELNGAVLIRYNMHSKFV